MFSQCICDVVDLLLQCEDLGPLFVEEVEQLTVCFEGLFEGIGSVTNRVFFLFHHKTSFSKKTIQKHTSIKNRPQSKKIFMATQYKKTEAETWQTMWGSIKSFRSPDEKKLCSLFASDGLIQRRPCGSQCREVVGGKSIFLRDVWHP